MMRAPALLQFLATGMILAGSGCGKKPECTGECAIGSPKLALGGTSGPEMIYANFPNPCEIDVDFGSLPTGQRATAVIQIEDVGTTALNLDFGKPSLDPEFEVDAGRPQPIQPGTFGEFTVSFEPLDAGMASSTFTIQTDGENGWCPAPTDSMIGDDITVVLAGTGS